VLIPAITAYVLILVLTSGISMLIFNYDQLLLRDVVDEKIASSMNMIFIPADRA